jgi:hypothetical protein
MSHILGYLSIEDLAGTSALLRDYTREPDGEVSKSLRRYGRSWAEAAGGPDGRTGAEWNAVIDEIESLSARVGSRDDVLRKLDGAKTRETGFVVTGQQPGTLGGPLHTVYKVATALALAARIEAVTGRPTMPLYWIGADDSDFQEIRSLHLWTDQLSPVSTAIAQESHQGGMPVGDVGLDALARVFGDVKPFMEAFAGGPGVASLIDRALQSANDHGELSAAVLTGLFDGEVVCVDGRSRSLRRFGRSLFQGYLASESDIKSEINLAGHHLDQLGYHSQLVLGEEPGVFVIEDGRRKSVTESDRAMLQRMATDDVENLSPGVVLRNLLQDDAFRPLAVVLGPAELAYRAQMTSTYARLEVPRPVAVPRAGGTFVPPELADLAELHGGDLPILIEKPAEFARATYRDALPQALRDAASAFQAEVTRLTDGFVDAHVGELPHKVQGKVTGRFKDVARRAEGAVDTLLDGGKSAAMERWPFLADLPDLIRPGHKLQERTLSGLIPFLFGGEKAADVIVEIASDHIAQLMDDRMSHIVYSIQS